MINVFSILWELLDGTRAFLLSAFRAHTLSAVLGTRKGLDTFYEYSKC